MYTHTHIHTHIHTHTHTHTHTYICIYIYTYVHKCTVSLKSQYVSSPLDVYEPFLSPTVPKLRMATLNSRSVVNKSAVINNHILENKIDILCITETWIND